MVSVTRWSLLSVGLLTLGHLTGNSIPWSWFQRSSGTDLDKFCCASISCALKEALETLSACLMKLETLNISAWHREFDPGQRSGGPWWICTIDLLDLEP